MRDRARLWNVPNLISLSRAGLAVAFLLVQNTHVRIALVLAAALSDFLDGFIARVADLRSTAGALIDPISDRIFVLAAVSAYLADARFSLVEYFTFISRDLATAVGFLVARVVSSLRPVVFRARLLGKAVTVLQLATLVAVLVWPAAIQGMVLAIGILSAGSILDYTLALWRARVRS